MGKTPLCLEDKGLIITHQKDTPFRQSLHPWDGQDNIQRLFQLLFLGASLKRNAEEFVQYLMSPGNPPDLLLTVLDFRSHLIKTFCKAVKFITERRFNITGIISVTDPLNSGGQ